MKIRWFKNGDHPDDDCFRPFEDTGKIPEEKREGKVVRYFRRPDVSGKNLCPFCQHIFHEHGWIDSGGDGRVVCPGDWVVSNDGEKQYYPIKDDILEYVKVKSCT